MKTRHKSAAFTLTELILCVLLIAILTILLLPAVSKAREMSLSASCLSNQRIIGNALLSYAADNQNWLPACVKGHQLWYQMVNPYLPQKAKPYRCPAHKPTAPDWLSYGYNAKFGMVDKDDIRTVSSDPGFYERHNLLRFKEQSKTTMLIDLKHAQGTANYNGGVGPVFYYDGKTGADYRHFDGMNVLWVDGHSSHVTQEEAKLWVGKTPEWNGAGNYTP